MLTPRCRVRNSVRKGRTKIPTRLMSVPTYRYKKTRGSPVTVCLRPLNLGSAILRLLDVFGMHVPIGIAEQLAHFQLGGVKLIFADEGQLASALEQRHRLIQRQAAR